MCYIDYFAWLAFLDRVEFQVINEVKIKKLRLNKKLDDLLRAKQAKSYPPIKEVSDYVKDLSTVDFSVQELALLNKGLKYTPQRKNLNVDNLVINVETAIKYSPDSRKEAIRDNVKNIIENNKQANSNYLRIQAEQNIIASLKKKEVYYLKADKGNAMVILDKIEYDRRMINAISENNFVKLKKNPLPKMVREANQMAKKISEVLDMPKWKLVLPNPKIPRIYGLPKIHKPGDKMRIICSNLEAPALNIAKWLVQEFRGLTPPVGLFVKNSWDVVEKLKMIKLETDEILVSFDVQALYPSIPINEAINAIEEWLRNQNVNEEKVNVYLDALKLCMNQNQFQFRTNYFKQVNGTSMGNPISCFLANVFMCKFELEIKNENISPKLWLRYVDDILVIIKKNKVDEFFNVINRKHETIEFTMEIENERKLPFLDLLLIREGDKINFDVYRKPCTTKRFITRDSFCPIQHKMASFNSMINRLCRLPLSIENYKREYEYIKDVALVNGFCPREIDKLISKTAMKVRQQEFTTLSRIDKLKTNGRAKLVYQGKITQKIGNHLKIKENLEPVFANNGRLMDKLGSTKDKIEDTQKAGIYSITCNDCNKKYIGQTKRAISTRYKEHINHAKNQQPMRSSVAQHMIECDHFNIGSNALKLEKAVTNIKELDAWESLYINKNTNNSMNSDNGPIISGLFNICTANRR